MTRSDTTSFLLETAKLIGQANRIRNSCRDNYFWGIYGAKNSPVTDFENIQF